MGSFAKYASSSSGGGSSEIDRQLAAAGYSPGAMADPEDSSPSLFGRVGGFVSNVAGDVRDFGLGISALAGQIGQDLTTLVDPVLPGKQGDGTFNTDDIVKNFIPNLADYAYDQYGFAPLKGDFLDLKKVGHAAYHDPLNTLLDVYGVSSLAGGVASKIKPPDPSKLVSKRIVESGGKINVAEKMLSPNPVRRATQRGLRHVLTKDVDKSLPDEIAKVVDVVKEFPDPDDALSQFLTTPEAMQKARVYLTAKQEGIQRISHRLPASLEVRATASRILGGVKAAGYYTRNLDLERLESAFSHLDEGGLQRIEKIVQGNERVASAGITTFQDISAKFDQVKANLTPDEANIFQAAHDRVNGYIVEQTQKVKELRNAIRRGRHAGQDTAPLRQQMDFHRNEVPAAMAYLEDLSEFLHVAETRRTGGIIPQETKAIAQARLARHETLQKSIDEGRMAGYDDIMRRTYAVPLIEDFAPRHPTNVSKTREINIKEFYKNGGYRQLESAHPNYWRMKRQDFLDPDTGKGVETPPVYFPHIDPTRLKPSDMMIGRGTSGATRQAGNAPFKENAYWNYLNKRYLRDPVAAYSIRQAQMVRILETQKLVETMINQFGRKLKSHDDFNPDAERIYNPSLLKHRYRALAEMQDVIAEAKMVGDVIEGGKGKPSDIASKDLMNIIERHWSEDSAYLEEIARGEIYAIPKVVADQLESFSKYNVGGEKLRLFHDGTMGLWRTAVLSLSPRWVVNNILGNIMFLKMQGGRISDVLKDWLSPEFRDRVDQLIKDQPPDVQQQISHGFFSMQTEMYTPQLGSGAGTPFGQALTRGRDSWVGQKLKNQAERTQKFNGAVENHFRRASFLKAAERQAAIRQTKLVGNRFFSSLNRIEDLSKKGLPSGQQARETAIRGAVDEMNFFLNDYHKMGGMEKGVIRRFIAPFYSFYKHVALLLMKYPFAMPERALLMRQLNELATEMYEDEALGEVPDFMHGMLPVGEGATEGETRFLGMRGLNPFEGFARTIGDPSQIGSQLGPIPQAALEYITGRDSLTGAPYSEPGITTPYGSDQQYKALYDDEGNYLGPAPTNARQNPLELLFGTLPQYELVRDAISIAPYPGNETPWEVASRDPSGNEVYEQGEPRSRDSFLQELLGFAGVPTMDYDLAKYQERKERERKMAAIQHLRAQGIIPPVQEEV